MLNRRSFIKGLIGSGITLCHGSVFAGIGDIKNTAESSIVIEGKKYVAAPIYTPEEARAAFSSALAEWPSVRNEISRIVDRIGKLNDIDENRMWVEVGYLSNAIATLYAEWEKRHGIISVYRKHHHTKLLAWTKDGELVGPPYGFDDLAKDEQVFTRSEQYVSNMTSGEYIVTIDGVRYYGAPTYTSEKVRDVFADTLAELPNLRKKIEKISNTISRLEEFGGRRMHADVKLLNCEISHLIDEFEKQHGIAQVYSIDDGEFHLVAWTENGMVTGPVFKL